MSELGRFLRARRERLAPEAVGLPRDGRRRTPGLRRAELAARAGVAVDYYARVEQGRAGSPTPSVLDALARALLLSEAERLHLHRLARRAGPEGTPRSTVSPDTRTLLDALGAHPALVLDPRASPLAWNAAADQLFGGFAARPPQERNLLLLLYGGGVRLPDDELAPALVAGLRARRAGPDDDAAIAAVVARVARTSPLFAKLWAEHHVEEARRGSARLIHPGRGPLTATWASLALPECGQRLLTLAPEDPLRQLAARAQGAEQRQGVRAGRDTLLLQPALRSAGGAAGGRR